MPRKKLVEGHGQPIELIQLFHIHAFTLSRSLVEKDTSADIRIHMSAVKASTIKFNLKIIFRKLFITNHYQYRLRPCLELAKDLLEETNDTFDQILIKLGSKPKMALTLPSKKPIISPQND